MYVYIYIYYVYVIVLLIYHVTGKLCAMRHVLYFNKPKLRQAAARKDVDLSALTIVPGAAPAASQLNATNLDGRLNSADSIAAPLACQASSQHRSGERLVLSTLHIRTHLIRRHPKCDWVRWPYLPPTRTSKAQLSLLCKGLHLYNWNWQLLPEKPHAAQHGILTSQYEPVKTPYKGSV